MSEIRVIEGEIFRDDRGQISSLNEFRFKGVERFYFIYHPDVNVVRGWHGHQYEKKWFYCVKGAFTLALVKIDNWENPSPSLLPEIFQLSDQKSESGSILLVYSGKIFQEALKDSWRYDKKLWVNWDKY